MGQRVSTMVRTTTNKGEHRRRADRWTTCRNSCTYSIQPAPTQRFGRKGQEQRWLERHGRQRRGRQRGERWCRSWWLLTAFVCFFARSDRATTREGVRLLLFCSTWSSTRDTTDQNSQKSFEPKKLPMVRTSTWTKILSNPLKFDSCRNICPRGLTKANKI